jgi:hypothetical protein
MHRFVALGCSLTAQDGFISYFNKKYNLDIKNLAEGAGSNGLQMFRLNNLLYQNLVDNNTTLLWQVTGPDRAFQLIDTRYITDENIFKPSPNTGRFSYTKETIYPFNVISINPLSNNLYWKDKDKNYKLNLQTVFCDVYKWSKIVKNIILYFGWSDLLDLSKDDVNNAMSLIRSCDNITILDLPYSVVDWCKSRNLQFEEDKWHPTQESYEIWGSHVLEPLLEKELK